MLKRESRVKCKALSSARGFFVSLFFALNEMFRSRGLSALATFPLFVRVLGRFWYKVRQLVPLFVRVLGRIWYKVRSCLTGFVVLHAVLSYKVRKVVRALRRA